MIQDYYCQQKFYWLTVRLYDATVASCAQAGYNALPLSVIQNKSFGIFNYPSIQSDRMKMLANEPVEDCESCWEVERKGLVSRRQKFCSTDRTYHKVLVDRPEVINLIVSNTCNQTCVYCDKTFSNSWLRDIVQNGPYHTDNDGVRLKVTDKDRVIYQISQKQLAQTTTQHEILAQVTRWADGIRFQITGGEPLLCNDLVDIVSRIALAKEIKLYTGLQVDPKRLLRICNDLHAIRPDIQFIISIENIGSAHEFVRYGSKWSIFLQNLDTVKNLFNTVYRSTVSNLTMFGLADFLQHFQNEEITLVPLVEPIYLRAGVMDAESKNNLAARLAGKHDIMPQIIDHLMDDDDLSQKGNLKIYVNEFARRRALQMDIFPDSFIKWINVP